MKNGQTREGIRWHSSYDEEYVKAVVFEKVKKTIGRLAIKWVDVQIVRRPPGNSRMETKSL
jgi:hypothetical protein